MSPLKKMRGVVMCRQVLFPEICPWRKQLLPICGLMRDNSELTTLWVNSCSVLLCVAEIKCSLMTWMLVCSHWWRQHAYVREKTGLQRAFSKLDLLFLAYANMLAARASVVIGFSGVPHWCWWGRWQMVALLYFCLSCASDSSLCFSLKSE